MDQIKEIHSFLSQFGAFSIEDLDFVMPFFRFKTHKKKEIVFRIGKVCNSLLIVTKGFYRVYIEKEDIEQTVHIVGPKDFVSSFASFISRIPSEEQVQSITEAEGFLLDYDNLQNIYKSHPKYERMGRLILENLFVRKENRVISLIKHSAELRYNELIKTNPGIVRNVPLVYIASYLGIKPETLSRIRAKV